MKDTVIFDLDGTLRDGTHRAHLFPTENLDRTESYLEYNLACGDDTPIMDNILLMRALHRSYYIGILTSCSDVAQSVTLKWLQKQGAYFSDLIMRPEDDHRTDTEFKEAKLREIGLDRIVCCFDDNPRVVRHLRSLGLTVHEVRHYENNEAHAK